MTDYTFAGYKLNATSHTHKGDLYEYKDANVSVWLSLDYASRSDGMFASATKKVKGRIYTSKRDNGCVWHPTVEEAFAALQRDIDTTPYKFGDFMLSPCEGEHDVYEYTGPSLWLLLHVDHQDMDGKNFLVRGKVDLGIDNIRLHSEWKPTLEEAYSAIRKQVAAAKVVLASIETLIK